VLIIKQKKRFFWWS